MLLYFESPEQLDLTQLLCVYRESLESGDLFSSTQEFYDYWSCGFFSQTGVSCAVWEEDGVYISAMCLEPYRDGLLVTALETRPEERGRGMAGKLISAVLQRLKSDDDLKIYSHIQRRNIPSLRLHKSCGFSFCSDHAVFLDGSISRNYDTYLLKV